MKIRDQIKSDIDGILEGNVITIENNFKYHPPKPGQPEKYHALRTAGKELAYLINDLCPEGREKNLAMTKLEEVIMWANASIARNE